MNKLQAVSNRKRREEKWDAGGEGSRGGVIIGRTSSGKPIYENHKHPSHSGFTKDDHRDALAVQEKRRKDLPDIHFKDQNNPTKEEVKGFVKKDNKIFKAIGFHDQKSKSGGFSAGSIIKNVAASKGIKRAGF